MDPFSLYDDARLYDALRRACLLETEAKQDEILNEKQLMPTSSRFTLESVIEPEGLNLSVGERSLLSLARALVKDSQIVILDEAT